MADSRKRNTCIDLMECIAILMVVVYHSSLYTFDIYHEPTALNYLRYLFRTTLSPCVPIFFFVNGYLLLNHELNVRKHVYRTIRITALCIIWGLLKLIVLMPIKQEYLGFTELLEGLLEWKDGWINSLWFLGVLINIYVFFPLIKAAFDHNRKAFNFFLIITAILTFGATILNDIGSFVLIKIMHRHYTMEGFNIFNTFNPYRGTQGYVFVYFCLGGLIKDYEEKILSIPPAKRRAAALALMAVCCVGLWMMGVAYTRCYGGYIWGVVWGGYDKVFTLVNVLCIFTLCLDFRSNNAFVRNLSANTLGIYLIHEVFLQMTQPYLLRVGFLCNVPGTIVYAVALLLLSLGVVMIMRRIPIIKRLVS